MKWYFGGYGSFQTTLLFRQCSPVLCTILHSRDLGDNDESGDALYFEMVAQVLLALAVVVWERNPWHLAEVVLKILL